MCTNCDWQCDDAFWINSISTEANQWGLERCKPLWIQPQLLVGRHVYYIHRAIIINQYSPCVETLNFQYNNEWIIMELLNPVCIPFRERDIVTFWSLILWGWMLYVNTIDLPIISLLHRLVRPSWEGSLCYRLYLTHSLLWMISSIFLDIVEGFVLSPWSGVVVPLDELLELSSLDQHFYLFF